MNYVLDSHTHTIASGHAYNTLNEMMAAAADKDLELLAITDHAPALPGAPHLFYYTNARVIDRDYYYEKYGRKTRLLFGTEVNILPDGTVDLRDSTLSHLDIVIASMHLPCINPGSESENTAHCISALENPHIHILGHPDDGRYPVDMEALVQCAKEHGKILELNNHSLSPASHRPGALENDTRMLNLCRQYSQPIVVGSDAHTESRVGSHAEAYALIEEVAFPEELVLNTSVDRFLSYLN